MIRDRSEEFVSRLKDFVYKWESSLWNALLDKLAMRPEGHPLMRIDVIWKRIVCFSKTTFFRSKYLFFKNNIFGFKFGVRQADDEDYRDEGCRDEGKNDEGYRDEGYCG